MRLEAPLHVHLIDGTYELFRHYYAMPPARDRDGMNVAAVRGVIGSLLGLINRGATHVGVATDHVIESFRNRMWSGYKTSEGIEPDLLKQFGLLEEALSTLGLTVWPMIEYEADDALASAARLAARDERVEQVVICTPDKDLAQSVVGSRIVQLNRRTGVTLDEAGVRARFGVRPASIPDYLALVGDAADGYPGLPGWGAKSSAAVLARFEHLESIPADWRTWGVNAASPAALANTLERERDRAFLFRDLATLRADLDLFESIRCAPMDRTGREIRGVGAAVRRSRGRTAAQETLGRAPLHMVFAAFERPQPIVDAGRAEGAGEDVGPTAVERRPHDAAQGHEPVVDLDDDVRPPLAGARPEGRVLVDLLGNQLLQLVVFQDFRLCRP